jgi:hypothetical protein
VSNARELPLIQQLLSAFAKSGPWALLTACILAFVAWQLDKFVSTAGTTVTDYVYQSGKNMAELQKGMYELAQAKTVTLEGLSELAETARANGEQIKQNGLQIQANGHQIQLTAKQTEEILRTMIAAQEMMKGVPEERKTQTELLRRIDLGIQELTGKLTDHQGTPP